jgi:hypothetical protein
MFHDVKAAYDVERLICEPRRSHFALVNVDLSALPGSLSSHMKYFKAMLLPSFPKRLEEIATGAAYIENRSARRKSLQQHFTRDAIIFAKVREILGDPLDIVPRQLRVMPIEVMRGGLNGLEHKTTTPTRNDGGNSKALIWSPRIERIAGNMTHLESGTQAPTLT